MRGPLASITLLVLLSGSTAGVGAFADAGHRVVGLIAEHHLRGARAVYDDLAMLREKTRGNLEPDEAEHIEQVLHELREAFARAGVSTEAE